jgi:hypothetical protein
MRSLFRRYRQLAVAEKRLYSLLAVFTLLALLLYCLGISSYLLRSRLVPQMAMEAPPTSTATPTSMPTTVATPGDTATPTATLPPTPTQRPIPTLTPTPESVNVTVVITGTDGLTTTTVISATVTPTPVLTATLTITSETPLSPTGTAEPDEVSVAPSQANCPWAAFSRASSSPDVTDFRLVDLDCAPWSQRLRGRVAAFAA